MITAYLVYDRSAGTEAAAQLIECSQQSDVPVEIVDWSTGARDGLASRLQAVDLVLVQCPAAEVLGVGMCDEVALVRVLGVDYVLVQGGRRARSRVPAGESDRPVYHATASNLRSLAAGWR